MEQILYLAALQQQAAVEAVMAHCLMVARVGLAVVDLAKPPVPQVVVTLQQLFRAKATMEPREITSDLLRTIVVRAAVAEPMLPVLTVTEEPEFPRR